MSNHNHGSTYRMIEIKPIHNNQTAVEPEQTAEEQVQQLHDEAEKRFDEAERHLEETKVKAEKILEENKKQIKQEKDNWIEERAVIVKQAETEGFSEGYKSGQEQGYQEYSQKLLQANEIIDQAKSEYLSIVESSEESILELALKCAEKIVDVNLENSPETYFNIVKRAVKEVKDQPEITVYVHPNQYSHVQAQREELQTITDSKTELSIYVREAVEQNSCIIESPFGRIDAGVDSQLKELRKKLFELAHEEMANE